MTGRCIDKKCNDGPPDEDGQPLPRWAAEQQNVCRRCETLLEQRLAELPARRDQLRDVLGGMQGSHKGGNKPTKGTPPVPLNLAAHDHLTAVHAMLASWAMLVREERGLRGPDGDDSAVLARWLLGQLDWLVQQPWIDDLADEIRDASRVADGITRAHPQRHRLPAPCPDEKCGAHELSRLDGADHVICLACGLTWHESDYARLVLVLRDHWTVTAREGAELADVPAGTFRRWVSEGHIRRVGTEDPARYHREDVEKMKQSKEDVA